MIDTLRVLDYQNVRDLPMPQKGGGARKVGYLRYIPGSIGYLELGRGKGVEHLLYKPGSMGYTRQAGIKTSGSVFGH